MALSRRMESGEVVKWGNGKEMRKHSNKNVVELENS